MAAGPPPPLSWCHRCAHWNANPRKPGYDAWWCVDCGALTTGLHAHKAGKLPRPAGTLAP